MTNPEIKTSTVVPSEVLGPPNSVWSVSSHFLVKVLKRNQTFMLKIEDGLPRFVHFLFLEIVICFPSLYVVIFPCWNCVFWTISGSWKCSENTEIQFASEIFFP